MRTTIRLDDSLLSEAKQFAARTRTTLTSVIEDALRQHLNAARSVREDAKPYRVGVFKKESGLQPGVDLDDSAALLDLMESYDNAVRRERAGKRAPAGRKRA